jgi:hypothetical protein
MVTNFHTVTLSSLAALLWPAEGLDGLLFLIARVLKLFIVKLSCRYSICYYNHTAQRCM